jgi:hypothetical protein
MDPVQQQVAAFYSQHMERTEEQSLPRESFRTTTHPWDKDVTGGH